MTRIRLIRELDTGGMGRVYEGILEYPFGTARRVAVKLLRRDKRDESSLVRFAREIETAGDLSHEHENLVTTHWCGVTSKGDLYVVMQFLDVSLRTLSAGGPLSHAVIWRIARDVLRALEYLHANNIEHRDVSPANILIKRDGTVKLGDFGLVRRESGSVSGRVRGTPPYTSPEGYLGGKQSAKSDLYSLGAVLYELVMGEPPYGKDNASEIAKAIKKKRAPTSLPDGLAKPLADVIEGLIRRRPKSRLKESKALQQLDAESDQMASKTMVAKLVTERVPEPKMPGPDVDNTEVLLAGAVLRAAPKLTFEPGLPLDHGDTASKPESMKPRSRQLWLPWAVACSSILLAVYVGWLSPRGEPPSWPERAERTRGAGESVAAEAPASDATTRDDPLAHAADADKAIDGATRNEGSTQPALSAAKRSERPEPSDTLIPKKRSRATRKQPSGQPPEPGPSSNPEKALMYAIPEREIPPIGLGASP